jgi:FkbM family methyltransferase
MNIFHFCCRLRLAFSIDADLWQRIRLVFFIVVKPSLVFRDFSSFIPSRIIAFSIRGKHQESIKIRVRDNGIAPSTIAEFFSPLSNILPLDFPSFQPKVIYDLGANFGVSSLFLFSLYPKATIYGFEPVPDNLEVCFLNYECISNSSRVFPWAIGATTGQAVFECQNDSRGGRLGTVQHNPHLKTVSKFQVQIYSIADLVLKENLPPPDFLKIDVEGAECDVFEGLKDYAHAVNCIYLETHGEKLKHKCLAWLKKHNFKLSEGKDSESIWAWRL